MSSQVVELSSLEKLPWLTGSDFDAAFNEINPNLLRILKNECSDLHQPAIKAFEQLFKCIDARITENHWQQILQNSSTALLSCFSRNLTQAKTLSIDENITLLKRILQENICILSSLDALIIALNNVQDIRIEIVPTVPKDTIEMMLFTFQFCKNSDTVIINTEEVTQMFKTCYGLLCRYFTFLNKLKINCQYENEFNLLLQVLEKIYEVGAIVISLDLKTMAELWKGFTHILKTYAVFLRNEFNVSKTIRFLIKQITERVTSLYDNTDEKMLNLTSKISVFLLKIMVKLCEYFEDCYGDCLPDLFEFTIFLYKHSCCFGQFCEVNANVINKIDTFLLPGVDPLLTLLINEKQFVNYFSNLNLSCFENIAEKVSLLLLLALIMRKLPSCTKDVLHLWLNAEVSILHTCFKMICQLSKELCYDVTVNLPCLDATVSQEVYLYDALLINISTLIINEISYQKFHVIENLLLSNLLNSTTPLMALFVSDLWCILARYGTSELCFQHTKFLVTLSAKCENPKLRVHLRVLIKRLFSFLSSTHQLQIMSLLPLDDDFVICFDKLDRKFKTEISQKTISDSANKYKCLQASLKQKFHPDDHAKMIKLTSLLSNFEPEFSNDFLASSITDYLVQTWKRLNGQSIANINLPDFRSLITTLIHLSKTTGHLTTRLSSTNVITILQSISCLLRTESLYVKLCCLEVLKNLENYQIESHFNEISNSLAACFSGFLKDADPIVNQCSLDIFTHFSHVTKYENIIALTISKDKSVAENVASYLQRNPSASLKYKNFHQFFDALEKQTIAFSSISRMDSAPNDCSSVKRIKLQDDFSDKISIIENNMQSLLDCVKNNQLNGQQKESLRRILSCVDKLKIYL